MDRKTGSQGDDAGFMQDAGGTGTAFGTLGGAIAGGIVGSVGGPGGIVVGALVGAAAGGAVGHAVGAGGWADSGEKYWRENLSTQPFFQKGYDYADYADALRLGYEGFPGGGKTFEESETLLSEEWERRKGTSRLSWEQARQAARAAWEHAHSHSRESG